MPTDIERIVDRKLIKQRVHYFVVWKGFGEENNTWESRVDLMADGYSDVIKRFEEHRKNETGRSTPRGRSPGRSTSKSPRKSKSPARTSSRPRGRRSRSRSASVSRKLPVSTKDEETVSPVKSTTSRRRKSPRHNEVKEKETPRRRSARKLATDSSTNQFVSRLEDKKADPVTEEDDDDSLLLRSTIAALAPQVREMTPPALSKTDVRKKTMTLSYEEDEECEVLLKSQSNKETATESVREQVQDGVIAKVVESGYLASVLTVMAVVGSLVASQMLPRDLEGDTEVWRRWLSFLTPIVALLLFFHQKDARASAKWVATGLAWRAAAELLLLIGSTPREFETMVAGSAGLANLSLLIALVSILRNGEHEQSKSTLALLTVGVLTLFLSDSWVISTENSELESRVVLMSMAVVSTSNILLKKTKD
ncbi:Chromodomain protein [Phytophthora megakarya]|uniref:Chromodomain protein n=1 Tax=Phytophthora megakarya TaxID=4795 RepID=A0A225W340_9STRA|nr:Chromodomain protein [Phytophthora megakarya]